MDVGFIGLGKIGQAHGATPARCRAHATRDRTGYAGYVGLEYRPLGTTEESRVWLEPRRQRSEMQVQP